MKEHCVVVVVAANSPYRRNRGGRAGDSGVSLPPIYTEWLEFEATGRAFVAVGISESNASPYPIVPFSSTLPPLPGPPPLLQPTTIFPLVLRLFPLDFSAGTFIPFAYFCRESNILKTRSLDRVRKGHLLYTISIYVHTYRRPYPSEFFIR